MIKGGFETGQSCAIGERFGYVLAHVLGLPNNGGQFIDYGEDFGLTKWATIHCYRNDLLSCRALQGNHNAVSNILLISDIFDLIANKRDPHFRFRRGPVRTEMLYERRRNSNVYAVKQDEELQFCAIDYGYSFPYEFDLNFALLRSILTHTLYTRKRRRSKVTQLVKSFSSIESFPLDDWPKELADRVDPIKKRMALIKAFLNKVIIDNDLKELEEGLF